MTRVLAIRRIAVSGGLVAAAFAIKYPLIAVPNVEPLTLAFFSVGYAFGPRWGFFIGAVGEVIYATFNPMGAPIMPVWVAQIAGMAIAGLAGGWVGFIAPKCSPAPRPSSPQGKVVGGEGPSVHQHLPGHLQVMPWLSLAIVVGAGVMVTAVFDLLTNLAMAWTIGPFWPVMIAGIPFAGLHIASNALLFLLIFPILRRWLVAAPNTVVEHSPLSPDG